MYLPKKNKPYIIIKYVFLLLFLSVFLQTKILTVRADEFVFDNSEGGFSGDMFWPGFLQDCGKDSYMDNRAGDFQDIQSEIIFNFETGKITGSIQGQYQSETWVVKNDNTAQGTINGVIEKKNDHGYADGWYWEFTGEVDFSLHYHMEHLCQSDSGDYWESKDQILHVKGELSGRTREESWFFYLSWEDYETRDGRRRHVHFLPDSQSFDVVFPKPIELDVSITTPNEVNLNSDSTPFQLNVVGRDIDMVDHIEWSFSYWEPDLEQYWLLYHESSFETQGLDTLEVSDAMRDEWRYVANEYGFEADDGAEIDLQIALSVFDSEWNNLIEFVFFEYTYYTSFGLEDTSGTGSTGGETSTSESGSGSNPIVIPDVSSGLPNLSGTLIQGAVSAGAGFGLASFIKSYFSKSKKKQVREVSPVIKEPQGATKGEDIIKLKKEGAGTRQARRKKRLEKLRKMFHVESVDSFLQWGLPWIVKGWSIQQKIDDKYETRRKSKGITREQEYKEIVKNKPKFLEEVLQKYVYEKTLGKTDLDVTTYLERNTSGEQMKEINQWNEHMHSKHSRDKKRAMESFGSSFAAVIGARG